MKPEKLCVAVLVMALPGTTGGKVIPSRMFDSNMVLQQNGLVPVGIVSSARSSTMVEQWISLETLAQFPQFAEAVAFYRDPTNFSLDGSDRRQRGPDFEK